MCEAEQIFCDCSREISRLGEFCWSGIYATVIQLQ